VPTINPEERKRLLQKRAKRKLEDAGYFMKRQQDGTYIVGNAETEEPLVRFQSIERLGQFFGLWGNPIPDAVTDYAEEILDKTGHWMRPPARDPLTGLDTPETAAVRENIKK